MPDKKSPRKRGRKTAAPSRQRHALAHSRRWSHHVMEHSDALDLESDIFKSGTPDAIAQSLKRSALKSRRRKASPFQSAMSMLNFYINRGGRNLSKSRRAALEQAKGKLREAFGRGER